MTGTSISSMFGSVSKIARARLTSSNAASTVSRPCLVKCVFKSCMFGVLSMLKSISLVIFDEIGRSTFCTKKVTGMNKFVNTSITRSSPHELPAIFVTSYEKALQWWNKGERKKKKEQIKSKIVIYTIARQAVFLMRCYNSSASSSVALHGSFSKIKIKNI